MNAEQAKQILENYRPRVDDNNPQFAEALAFAQRDADLAGWLAEQNAGYEALRRKFRQVAVPEDLRGRILSQQPARSRSSWWLRPAFVATVIAAAVGINLAGYFMFWREQPAIARRDFAGYLGTTTVWASGGYKMDVKTQDHDALRRLFAERGSPTDYLLLPGVAALNLEGGVVLDWGERKISVLCYEKKGGEDQDVWFFVVDRAAVSDAPATETPQFATANGLATAAWTRGDKLYVLATRGARADLESLL